MSDSLWHHRILQRIILGWFAIPSSRRSFWPRDWAWVSCIASRFFTVWATRQAPDTWGSFSKPFHSYASLSPPFSVPGILVSALLQQQTSHSHLLFSQNKPSSFSVSLCPIWGYVSSCGQSYSQCLSVPFLSCFPLLEVDSCHIYYCADLIMHLFSVQFSSVAQSCLTLCDPMNRSTPGLPVHH